MNSNDLAKKLNRRHVDVCTLIKRNIELFQEVGAVAQDEVKTATNSVKCYSLSNQQVMLFMLLSKPSEKDYKLRVKMAKGAEL